MDAQHSQIALPELLAPAGSLDALLAAVEAGADAVYTGVGAYNARAAATDLTFDELRRATAYAHARSCRVYVTFNVYLRPGELDDAVALAGRVLACGANAFIVADAGLCRALSRAYPGVELHLSTQAGVMSAAGARFVARELGVSRVTCARELSLSELAELAAGGIEIEAFCHGAICICYSGACAASALRRHRSANRGDCTQPCRLPYRLLDGEGEEKGAVEGDRLLCPRDYLSIRHLEELCRTGISALKIEGRMKNPDYVYNVVGTYRRALDLLAAGKSLGSAMLDGFEGQLGRSFNRGFTDAYLRGSSGAELMSFERAINQGTPVGAVVERRYDEVLVELSAPVNAGDTLEIRSTPGPDAPADVPKRWPMVPCAVDGNPGERIAVGVKRKVEVGSPVHVTASVRVLEEARAAVARAREALDAEQSCAAVPAPVNASDGSGAAALVPTPSTTPLGVAAARSRASVMALATRPEQARAWLELDVAAAGTLTVAVRACMLDEPENAESWLPLLPRLTVVLDEPSHAADEPAAVALMREAAAVVCRNWSQVALARDMGAAWEAAAPLSATNEATAALLGGLGARRVWLPDELGCDEVCHVAAGAPDVSLGALVYGSAQLMVCEHCLLTAEGLCSGDHERCARRRAERYLVDASGAKMPVRVDAHGRTRLYDEKTYSRLDDLAALEVAGVNGWLLDAQMLGEGEANRALDALLARCHIDREGSEHA